MQGQAHRMYSVLGSVIYMDKTWIVNFIFLREHALQVPNLHPVHSDM